VLALRLHLIVALAIPPGSRSRVGPWASVAAW
jgi:hypothetical protein